MGGGSSSLGSRGAGGARVAGRGFPSPWGQAAGVGGSGSGTHPAGFGSGSGVRPGGREGLRGGKKAIGFVFLCIYI